MIAELVLLLPGFGFFNGAAVDWVAKGNRAFAEGRYDAALAAYESALAEQPRASEILFNKGGAYYRKGEYAAAAQAFFQAGLRAGRLKPLCLYNGGNACVRMAEQRLKSDVRQAVILLGRAEAAYVHALKLDPDLNDARRNLELVRRRLAALTPPRPQSAAPFGEGRRNRTAFARPPREAPKSPPAVPFPRTPEEVLDRERQRNTARPKPSPARQAAIKDW